MDISWQIIVIFLQLTHDLFVILEWLLVRCSMAMTWIVSLVYKINSLTVSYLNITISDIHLLLWKEHCGALMDHILNSTWSKVLSEGKVFVKATIIIIHDWSFAVHSSALSFGSVGCFLQRYRKSEKLHAASGGSISREGLVLSLNGLLTNSDRYVDINQADGSFMVYNGSVFLNLSPISVAQDLSYWGLSLSDVLYV